MEPRDLSDHDTYEAGRGIAEVARELGRDPDEFVKLASNENPHGPSERATEAIRRGADRVNVYPKASHTDLQDAVADRWAVDPAQVWLANGADGAIDCLCRAMLDPWDRVLVPDPGFAYYPMSARFHHGEVSTYELSGAAFDDVAEAVLRAYEGERMVFLTSPHNPTGGTVPLAEVAQIADETAEHTLVVVDEAYAEFAPVPSAVSMLGGASQHVPGLHDLDPGGPGRGTGPERATETETGAEHRDRDDVAVLRTFSKAYGLAGIRLGYAVVPGAWADAYARVNTPFSAGELACRAGLAALDDDEHVRRSVASARRAREYMRDRLDAPVLPSHANFVLVDVGDAGAVTEATKRRGVIVRDCTSFGLPDRVRITCGTESETERAVEVVNEVLAEQARETESEPEPEPGR
jgi:histidinol-phosphate aminotransferase